MHYSILSKLQTDLTNIDKELNARDPDKWSIKKSGILSMLVTVRQDETDTLNGYKFLDDVFPQIALNYGLSSEKDTTLLDLLADLGFLLNTQHELYRDNQLNSQQESLEVYDYIIQSMGG